MLQGAGITWNAGGKKGHSLDIVEASKAAIKGRGLEVALPEPEDERILRAAERLSEAGLALPLLIGKAADVATRAASAGVKLDGCEVRDPASDGRLAAYAAHITAGRERMTAGMAERMLRRPLYFAGAMTAAGDSAAMVAGAANPTKRVIEAGLMTIGLAPGITTPSSFFLMIVPERDGKQRSYIFADCAINADPSPQELAAIAIASADSARSLLHEEPRVALLSFSTHGSAAHPRVDKVLGALAVAKGLRPDLAIEGELQGDAAVTPAVAAKKVRGESSVAGRANVLIFPDLDSGNIAYKLVQHLGGATAIGPFLQGFAKPISDLSRGATVDDIVATVAVTLARSLG
jgi:phosphate acetyltransferase